MIRELMIAATLATITVANAVERCRIEPTTPEGNLSVGRWIHPGNWLDPGNLRAAQAHLPKLVPAIHIKPPSPSGVRSTGGTQLDLHSIAMADPADNTHRSIRFILDNRIDADAMVVMRNGRVVAEYYRDQIGADQPRLLLSGGRPILSILAAKAIAQERLAIDKAVSRALPGGQEDAALRKLSVRRLLDGEAHFIFSDEQVTQWQKLSGWSGNSAGNLRDWMATPGFWDDPVPRTALPPPVGLPEDDLLGWVISASQKETLSRLLCDGLLTPMRAEHPALWITDAAGNELAAGLALTPRDFALLGQLLLDNRSAGKRGTLPEWLLAAVSAPAAKRSDSSLTGFPEGSEFRYGFVRLGGKSSRIVLLGPYGTSLLVDFDRRMTVALFATHASPASPLLFATLGELWQTLAAQPFRKNN